jgi:oxalate decarboxylase
MSVAATGNGVSRTASLSDPRAGEQSAPARESQLQRPPPTDRGNPGPLWYSFDLAPKRVEAGGWTHQVTHTRASVVDRPCGVNMRLTAGSFRELHWHKANEWAIMLSGKPG